MNNSGYGPWSEIRKFKTAYDCPILFNPANNDTSVSYNTLFDWSDYPGSNYYRVQISRDSLFASTVYNLNWLSNSEFRLIFAMLQNTYYYWRVNSRYNNSYLSLWSETRKFKTTPTYTHITVNQEIPSEFKLYDNFPNPFNPCSTIRFDIPDQEHVILVIYNSIGKLMKNLVDRDLKAGKYEIEFNGEDIPSGLYFYRIIAGKYSETKKMVLIK